MTERSLGGPLFGLVVGGDRMIVSNSSAKKLIAHRYLLIAEVGWPNRVVFLPS